MGRQKIVFTDGIMTMGYRFDPGWKYVFSRISLKSSRFS